jgi:hypothetical protein
MQKTNELMVEMKEILKNEIAERHSYFQMKYFIINKEPTIQSKMWQCLREIKTRHESLESIMLEIDDGKDNLELIDINIDKLEDTLRKRIGKEDSKSELREMEIGISKMKRKKVLSEKNLEVLTKKMSHLEEEANFFVITFESLNKIEPLRNYDDIDSQKQYWNEKLLQKVNLKMLLHSTVDTEIIETVMALPDDLPIKQQTVKNLELRHGQMAHIKQQAEMSLANKQEKHGD